MTIHITPPRKEVLRARPTARVQAADPSLDRRHRDLPVRLSDCGEPAPWPFLAVVPAPARRYPVWVQAAAFLAGVALGLLVAHMFGGGPL